MIQQVSQTCIVHAATVILQTIAYWRSRSAGRQVSKRLVWVVDGSVKRNGIAAMGVVWRDDVLMERAGIE